MTYTCTHEMTSEREGDTWTDEYGKPHTVVHLKCANPFCARFGQTVRVRVEGDDTPTRYMMPPIHIKGGKP
jgi:hypothetical protein